MVSVAAHLPRITLEFPGPEQELYRKASWNPCWVSKLTLPEHFHPFESPWYPQTHWWWWSDHSRQPTWWLLSRNSQGIQCFPAVYSQHFVLRGFLPESWWRSSIATRHIRNQKCRENVENLPWGHGQAAGEKLGATISNTLFLSPQDKFYHCPAEFQVQQTSEKHLWSHHLAVSHGHVLTWSVTC